MIIALTRTHMHPATYMHKASHIYLYILTPAIIHIKQSHMVTYGHIYRLTYPHTFTQLYSYTVHSYQNIFCTHIHICMTYIIYTHYIYDMCIYTFCMYIHRENHFIQQTTLRVHGWGWGWAGKGWKSTRLASSVPNLRRSGQARFNICGSTGVRLGGAAP